MILNSPYFTTSAELTELAREEAETEWRQATEESRRKDAARWSLRAVDKTIAEFELMGFTGFRVTRNEDGSLKFEGVGDVPEFLRESA